MSDPHISQRLAALEEVKIRKATAEEFDEAASLKSAIDNVTSLAEAVESLGQRMKHAAASEDYSEVRGRGARSHHGAYEQS